MWFMYIFNCLGCKTPAQSWWYIKVLILLSSYDADIVLLGKLWKKHTSFSIFISLMSCWWSFSFLISNTAFRLSNSCSRYMIWGFFCKRHSRTQLWLFNTRGYINRSCLWLHLEIGQTSSKRLLTFLKQLQRKRQKKGLENSNLSPSLWL